MKPNEISAPSSRRGRAAPPHQYLTKGSARPPRRRGNAEKLLFPHIRVFVEGVWERMENELMVVGAT